MAIEMMIQLKQPRGGVEAQGPSTSLGAWASLCLTLLMASTAFAGPQDTCEHGLFGTHRASEARPTLEMGSLDADLIKFSSDRERIILASSDGQVRLFDSTGSWLQTLRQNAPPLSRSRVLSAEMRKNTLLLTLQNGTIEIWRAVSGMWKLKSTIFTKKARFATLSPDETKLLLVLDKSATLWSSIDGEAKRIDRLDGFVQDAQFSPDGQTIAIAVNGKFIDIYDAQSFRRLSSIKHDGAQSVAFSSDGAKIISGSASGNVKVYDMRTKKVLHEADLNSSIVMTELNQDGTYALAASRQGQYIVLPLADGSQPYQLRSMEPLLAARFVGQRQIMAIDRNGTLNGWQPLR